MLVPSLCPSESMRGEEPDSFQSTSVLCYCTSGGWQWRRRRGRGRAHSFNDMQHARILKTIFTARLNTRDAPLPAPPAPPPPCTHPASCLKYVVQRSQGIRPSLVIRRLPPDEHPPSSAERRDRQSESCAGCHGCGGILLRRRRDGGRQRHIEADAEKCERVSVRLAMTRSWLRRAGEATALALTHLIPTGPPG